MQWHTIISYRGVVLQDPAKLSLAEAALRQHLSSVGCTAFEAAQAVFLQERPIRVADDGLTIVDDGQPETNGDWATAWRAAPDVVAEALQVTAADVVVDLQREDVPLLRQKEQRSRRLFLGLMATPETQAAIAGHQTMWEWPPEARLTSPEKIHLTLAFLGNVEATSEELLRRTLKTLSFEPLYLRTTAPEVFEGGIAVLQIEPIPALMRFRTQIIEMMRLMGLSIDRKPWRPHITLARSAQGCTPPAKPASVELNALQFSLVCSRPERAHSYEVIESWPG